MTSPTPSMNRKCQSLVGEQVQRRANVFSSPFFQRIAFHRTVSLGGIEQAIYVHGEDPGMPLLLFLHGGPGLPQTPFAHVNVDLAKSFIVVHWDQRGAGKSYSPGMSTKLLSIEQFVSDTHELILWLLQRFGKTRLVLVGHSWGSALGAIVAARYPHLVAAYVGIGQVSNPRSAELVRFQRALTLARQNCNRPATEALLRLGPPPYQSSLKSDSLEQWACRLTGECHRPIISAKFFRFALASPVYSWLDLLKIPLGNRFSERCLWGEIVQTIDLFRQVPHLEMPAYFLLGRYDTVGTYDLARDYVNALEAPCGKTFITFEDSGHWPHLEEPSRFRAVLTGLVHRELLEHSPAFPRRLVRPRAIDRGAVLAA